MNDFQCKEADNYIADPVNCRKLPCVCVCKGGGGGGWQGE